MNSLLSLADVSQVQKHESMYGLFQLLTAWGKCYLLKSFVFTFFLELSKSISLDLPGTDRLAELLLSSFQVRL